MVFIHPVILRDNTMTKIYTHGKYNHIRALQLGAKEDGINLVRKQKHPVLPPLDEPAPTPAVSPSETADSTEVFE